MKCRNCGAEFNVGVFCPECGSKNEDDNVQNISEEEIVNELVEQSNYKESKKIQDLEFEAAKRRQDLEFEALKRKQELEFEAEKRRHELNLEIEQKKAEVERQEAKRIEAEKAECERLAKKRAEQEAIERKKAEEVRLKKIENEGKAMSVISLILGIVSLLTGGIFIVPEILGIVFAFKGKKAGKMRKGSIAGIILSALAIIAFIVIIIVSFQ